MIPKVKIHSISRKIISSNPKADRSVAQFSFNVPVVEHRTKVLGVSPETGFRADGDSRTVDAMKNYTVDEMKNWTVDESRYVQDISDVLRTVDEARAWTVDETKQMTVDQALADYESVWLSAEIDWLELYQEGTNRVNIYGKNIHREWTPYEG